MRLENKQNTFKIVPSGFVFRFGLLILLTATLYRSAYSEYISLPLISSGFSWEASIDGINWIPPYPEYPNNLTIPYPATTDAVFMWYWNIANGNPTGTNGANIAYFRSKFMLTDLHGESAGAWIAADDWMNLSVNGVSAATYQLELNFNNERQPIPMFVDFTNLLNTRYQGDLTGYNTISIEAHDGGPIAYNRIYEWLFFDAYNVNTVPVLGSPANLHGDGSTGGVNVPEPSVVSLVIFGLISMALVRLRRVG